jgi:TonB-dependent starch-binding outer membrane protein SusC
MIQSLHKLPKVWLAGLFLLFLGMTSLSAQDRRITGKVGDATGGLPGATIVQKGTSNGTTSDIDGNFAMTVKGADPILVVSFTGFKTQEMKVGAQSAVTITLEDSDALITETVVTGYTVETRRQTTGSVSTVKTKDLSAIPTGNVEQMLQGRVPGVTVITNGQPGTSSIVRVRGFGAFGGNEPLYIVDGVPTNNTDFLAPDDIESTTVLKDAGAASIYGARAANGVIVFTTRKGKKTAQKMKVTYDALFGVTNPGKGQELLTPQEQADWTWKAFAANGVALSHPQYGTGANATLPDYINVGGASVTGSVDLAAEKLKYNIDPTIGGVYQVVKADKAGTDWYDAITRNAGVKRHGLGFTGSTENSRYYLGLNYQDQAGILIGNTFKRGSIRANTEFDLSDKVRIGENVQFTFRQVLGLIGGRGGRGVAADENDILQAFRMAPIIPVYDEFGGYAGTAAKGFNNPRNPVANRDGSKNDRSYDVGSFGNIYLEVDPIKNLTLKSSIGGRYYNYNYKFYSRLQYENSENNGSFGYGEGNGFGYDMAFTNTANYKMSFGESNIDVLLGTEALNVGNGRNIDASGINPFSNSTDFVSLSAVASRQVNSGQGTPKHFSSVFGKIGYALKDKYYLTGVIRRDGSSAFGPNSRFGIFPAISGAWRVTGEEFMNNSIFDDLKIRGGWGQMGNSQLDPANQYTLFSGSVDNASYDINGTNTSAQQGFYKSRVGNPDAKWETCTTTNLGFDALLFGGKLDVIVDLWKKTNTDLLFEVPLPAVLGVYAAAPARNIAEMENKGIDVMLATKGKFGSERNMGYELSLTGSWLRNKIVALAPGVDYFDQYTGRISGNAVRNQLDYSISAFYGYKVLGLFKDAAEVTGAPEQAGAGPGRFRFEDNNSLDDQGKLTGKPDGKITDADRTYLGSPVPKFLGGANLKFTFGSFDIETYMYASLGNKIYNLSRWFTDFYPSFQGAAVSSRVKDSWTPTNTGAEIPVFETVSNFSTNQESNSFYVEDGSYFRIQNLSLGYNLPLKSLGSTKFSRARIFASTNNLLTVSKYKGLDPGVGGAVDTNFGLDVGNYPVTRSYMVGLGLTF